jgi:hypothetical protein
MPSSWVPSRYSLLEKEKKEKEKRKIPLHRWYHH